MSKPAKHIYEFGLFRLETAECLLLKSGKAVPLTPKTFETLLMLVERSGHLVEKDELMSRLWPDTFVADGTLARNISDLRKALGETQNGHKYIETVPKRGYRFVATVRELPDGDAEPVVESHTRTRITAEVEKESSAQERIAHGVEPQMPQSGGRELRRSGWRLSPTSLLIGALLVGVAVALSLLVISRKRAVNSAVAAGRSIAVLPFQPIDAESRDEHLGLGMADALITKLSNVRQVVVRPTSAIFNFNDQGQDPLAIGRQLGVDVVLNGRVQRVGERVRVTVQLVSIPEGRSLWAEKFDEKFTHIFAVQDRVSEQVARALMLELTGAERQGLAKRYTENTEAYRLYLKGRYFWNKRTADGLKKAIEYFGQAIDIDPNYALAYAGLADCYVHVSTLQIPPAEGFSRAKAAALKALEIDETLAEAYPPLGTVYCRYELDQSSAERAYKRAIELNPNYALAHLHYSGYLTQMGRFNEAIPEHQLAQQLDPTSISISNVVAHNFYFARQYDQAIEQSRKTLEMDSNYPEAHHMLGWSYERKGMYEEAIAELSEAVRLSGRNMSLLASLGHAYAVSGRESEAHKVIDELQELSEQKRIPPYSMAKVYIGLGEKERALEWLEKAYQDRYFIMGYLKVDPHYDTLRTDPRFTSLLRRAGFAP